MFWKTIFPKSLIKNNQPMTSLLTKSKLITLGVCGIIISITSILFIFGEHKLNHDDFKASVLEISGFETTEDEDYYRKIVENYMDMVFILKKDATIHFLSENTGDKLNFSNDELKNNNLFNFIHPKDLPYFANNLIEIIQDQNEISNIGPFRIQKPNGEYDMYMSDGYPLTSKQNEEIIGIALILKDISRPLGNK